MTLTAEQRKKCDELITPKVVDTVRKATDSIIYKFRVPSRLHDDLYSAAYESLIGTAIRYKPDKDPNHSYTAYALTIAKYRVIDALRDNLGRNTGQPQEIYEKKWHHHNPFSIDWVQESDDGTELAFMGLSVDDLALDRVDDLDFVWSLIGNTREYLICVLYMLGFSQREIGEQYLGVSESRINQILGRMGDWATFTGNTRS